MKKIIKLFAMFLLLLNLSSCFGDASLAPTTVNFDVNYSLFNVTKNARSSNMEIVVGDRYEFKFNWLFKNIDINNIPENGIKYQVVLRLGRLLGTNENRRMIQSTRIGDITWDPLSNGDYVGNFTLLKSDILKNSQSSNSSSYSTNGPDTSNMKFIVIIDKVIDINNNSTATITDYFNIEFSSNEPNVSLENILQPQNFKQLLWEVKPGQIPPFSVNKMSDGRFGDYRIERTKGAVFIKIEIEGIRLPNYDTIEFTSNSQIVNIRRILDDNGRGSLQKARFRFILTASDPRDYRQQTSTWYEYEAPN
jgi:hypothetical protein